MRLSFAILLYSIVSITSSVFGASIKGVLDRDSIMAGETTFLRVIVEGGSPQSIQSFPPLPGLAIQYQGKTQEYSNVNGRASFKHVLSFAITAETPGKYTIPSIQVMADGQSYSTPPVQLNVQKNDLASQQNKSAFLRLVVPKKEVYVGEMMEVEIQLYVAGRGDNLQLPQLKGDGFVIHKHSEAQQYTTQLNNIPYNVVSFKMSVSPAKAGTLTLGPAECSFTMLFRAQPNPNDVFGDFFGARLQRRPVNLSSELHSIKVLPLPSQDVPEGFSGAIGQFQWAVTVNPTNLNAGDPITLKIAITGKGNLDAVKLPEFHWPGFKAYSPNSSVETTDPLGLRGTKRFEQVVAPEKPAISQVPPFQFAYFDPERKAYAALAHPATPILVRGSGTISVQPTLADAPGSAPLEEEPEPSDIVHIKPNPGKLLAFSPPLLQQPWFLAVQLIPLLGFAGVALWRKRQDQLDRNPKLRRKLEVRRLVHEGLAELRRKAQAQDGEGFFAGVFRLLQEQLGERLGMPAYSITESVIDERLAQRGASPALMDQLHRLFQLCNQVRYAPVQSAEDLLQVLPQVESALKGLQELPDEGQA